MHGWGGSKDSLKPIADSLKDEYTVTLIDLYGFGMSPHPEYPLKVSDYARAVADIINYYRMNSVVIVGHSFGGRVALELARFYSGVVDRMILIDSAGILPKRGLNYYIKVYRHKIRKLFGKEGLPGSADYRLLSGAMKGTFVGAVNYDQSVYLKYITAPCLIIWGENDKDTPLYMAKKLKRGLVNGSLAVISDAGHFSYIDKRQECLSYIKNYIGGENE